MAVQKWINVLFGGNSGAGKTSLLEIHFKQKFSKSHARKPDSYTEKLKGLGTGSHKTV